MAEKFKDTLNRHFKYVNKNVLFNSIGNGASSMIMSLLPIIILVYGGYLINNGLISLGSLIAFYTYLSKIYEPLSNLSYYNIGLQTALGMSERILEFLDADLDVDQGTVEISNFEYLEFKNVSFGYDDNNYVINNISFRINKGDKVALIGGSGSGKSTIVALIAKMYKPSAGEIIINGYKIDNIKKESLYNILTLLEQNPFVFSGTLEENITLGNCIDHNIVNKSILISKMDDLCANCKDNLNFNIAEFGTNLSGGQKQRLCLCRTLAKQSQVIILDEATSALDANLENSIIDNLNDFLCGYNKTLIAVSHKPSILKICNKIIHIENGQLRES
jgi:ATP-binding cassette subfamily B protein